MKLRAHTWDVLTGFAFFAAYIGFMGSLFVLNVPVLNPWRTAILIYLIAPLIVLGVIGIVFIHALRGR